MTARPPLKLFGWQGIELQVPVAWELQAHGGDYKAGYAALDDGIDVRLQVRWSDLKRGALKAGSTIEEYRRKLERAYKGNLTFDTRSADFLPRRLRQDKDAVAFSWKAGRAGFGLAWHCHTCRRAVLAEILFGTGETDCQSGDWRSQEADTALSQRILKSLACHREDGQRLWAVYGFAFLAPDTYNLERPELVPGRLQFLLRESRRSWLRVERWALASQWTRKAPLDQWPAEVLKLMRVTPVGPLEQTETDVRGNPGCRFTRRALRRGLRRQERVDGLVWIAHEEDKVFAVVAGGGREDLPERVAATVVCG